MKTIIELSHTEAKQYFLKQESYCNIVLPEYFVFNDLLKSLSTEITNQDINTICQKRQENDKSKPVLPKIFDNVNYTFYHNKDGKFAWRPSQLINPALYVFLVHKITIEDNWNFIIKRFEKFQENPKIKCCSLPVVTEEGSKSDKENTITNWWEKIEQQSLELAIQYHYFFNTDITDCYGSIYTHTITWALHDKQTAKDVVATKKESKESKIPKPAIYIGDDIDAILQSMQYAQTNGIPQDSVLMDFIAEMVLGYADMLLSEKIAKIEEVKDYQILRYRDDYRIFTNKREDANMIAKLLTEVLIGLNLRLNSQKTFLSGNLIQDSIKPDKLYWLGAKKGEKTLQKTLLLIHSLAEKYPNSGSLIRALSDFQKRLYKKKNIEKENINVLISIVVDIAYKNPRTYPLSTAILSKLLSFFENDKIKKSVSSIEEKFKKIPNVGHLDIWLQRITLKIEESKKYEEKLCKKVIDNNEVIWNTSWLNDTIKQKMDNIQIIDKEYIKNMDPIMKPGEVQSCQNGY
jgi:hypothetical protein